MSAKRQKKLEMWKQVLVRKLERADEKKWHGTLELTFYEGEVRTLKVERSVVDPEQELANADDGGL